MVIVVQNPSYPKCSCQRVDSFYRWQFWEFSEENYLCFCWHASVWCCLGRLNSSIKLLLWWIVLSLSEHQSESDDRDAQLIWNFVEHSFHFVIVLFLTLNWAIFLENAIRIIEIVFFALKLFCLAPEEM